MSAPNRNREKLEWAGTERRALFRLAGPIAVSMLSYSLMTTTDTLFVGRLGASALAGVGLAGITAFTLLAFAFGLMRAVKVLVSQARGAGKGPETTSAITAAGLFFAVAAGLFAMIAGQLVADLMPLVAETREAGRAASSYLRIRVLAAPLALAFAAYRETCYGLGKTSAPMRASIVANVVNVVLDAVLIFGVGWGVEGAALASVLATGVELAVIVGVAPRVRLADLRRGVGWVRRLFEVGAPTGIQFLVELGSFAALSFIISALAEVEMAAHQIALQVIHFSFLPAVAVGEAASIMSGEAVGADRDDLVRPIANAALVLCCSYMALCSLIVGLFGETIASAFTSDSDVIARARILLLLAAFFQVPDGVNIVGRCVLRGLGDVRFPAAFGILLAWALLPPSAWLLGSKAGFGAAGGWIGLALEISIGAAVFWHRLATRRWQRWADDSRRKLRESRSD